MGRVNNLSAGLFSSSAGLGEVIGPLFGAAMYERSGFRFTSDITAMVTFFYAFSFMFVLSNGTDTIRQTLARQVHREEEQEEQKETYNKSNKKVRKGDGKGSYVMEEETMSFGSQSLLSH